MNHPQSYLDDRPGFRMAQMSLRKQGMHDPGFYNQKSCITSTHVLPLLILMQLGHRVGRYVWDQGQVGTSWSDDTG
jgi:hypothetical protein